MPDKRYGGSKAGRTALSIAIGELREGAKEIGGENKGEWVKKYLHNLAPEGSSWCAAFVSYCYYQSGLKPFRYAISARGLLNELRQKNWSYERSGKVTPKPGDIVIWWRGSKDSWQGHAGLVHHFANGILYTIEGNRTSKVEGFCYKFMTMRRLLGFGHVPL